MTDVKPGEAENKDQRKKFRHSGPDQSRHQKEKPEARVRDPMNKPGKH